MCIVPQIKMKSVFTFQPKKRLVAKNAKIRKACCHVLNILFREQKPIFRLFSGDGTHYFARKTSRNYEKEKSSPFLEKFLRQSQPSTFETEQKKVEFIPIVA